MKRGFPLGAVLVVLCLAEVPGQSGPSPRTLSVDEAVKIALENNLSLRQNSLEAAGKKRARDLSWNNLLPTLNASAGLNRPSSLAGSVSPERKGWSPGFSVSASFDVSTAMIEHIKQARSDYDAGLLSYELARRELELQVRKLFYQILLLRADRELAAQTLESARLRHEESAALSKVGQASHLDELSARVDMENQRPKLRSADALYVNALDSFKTVLGIERGTDLVLQGNLEYEAGKENRGTSGAASLEAAVLRQKIKVLEAQRKEAWHGAYIPALEFSWTAKPSYSDKAWNDGAGSFSISLGISIDSFLPWSAAKKGLDDIDDNIRSSQLELAESLRNREDRIRQYERTVDQTIETIEALKLNVELAERTYRMYEEAYRKGGADYQSLRGAADSLSQAQNQVLEEYYNLIAAVLDLDKELNREFTF